MLLRRKTDRGHPRGDVQTSHALDADGLQRNGVVAAADQGVGASADAYRRARASAQSLANASGRTLGELSYASVDVSENIRVFAPAPRNRAMAAMAASVPAPTAEFSPQNVTVTAHVNAMFALK